VVEVDVAAGAVAEEASVVASYGFWVWDSMDSGIGHSECVLSAR